MKRLCYLCWLVGLGQLAGCHEAPRAAQSPGHPPPVAAVAARPAPAWAHDPGFSREGYRRYQGTMGGQPVLVELTTKPNLPELGAATCEGSYYFLRSGIGGRFDPIYYFEANKALETSFVPTGAAPAGNWCTDQPLGPVLSGTYTTAGGHLLGSFRLRESYAGAVRLELLSEELRARPGARQNGDQDTSSFTLCYLHLLGRDTLRPVLARLQCPVPARRLRARHLRAAKLVPTPDDQRVWLRESCCITLNEAYLLAYYREQEQAYGGSGRGYLTRQNHLVDLQTGRPLRLVRQLRPGGLLQLRRLLTRHARRDTAAHNLADYRQGELLRLPPEGFSFQPAGCDAYYGSEGSRDGNSSSFQETISWAELRPLLHPQSPLWRMIRARGL